MRLQNQPKFWQWIHWLARSKLPLNWSYGKVHNTPVKHHISWLWQNHWEKERERILWSEAFHNSTSAVAAQGQEKPADQCFRNGGKVIEVTQDEYHPSLSYLSYIQVDKIGYKRMETNEKYTRCNSKKIIKRKTIAFKCNDHVSFPLS